MRFLLCACCLVAISAGLACAQQNSPPAQFAKSPARIATPASPPRGGAYMGACGDWFRCYSGIPLRCGDNTRPWQNIAQHACFCVHDGCPQQ